MLAPQALLRALIARALPSANQDSQNNDAAVRAGRYGELMTMPAVRKAHVLADEGTYFTTNNAQTGVATNNGVAFSTTAPFIIIQNNNSLASGLRLYLDSCTLVTTVAGSAASGASSINAALVLDNILRYSSGGTNITANIVNNNMDSVSGSGAAAYVGALTATAASAVARTVSGFRILRPSVSATVLDVIGEQKILNFGNVEGGSGSFTIANANMVTLSLPPVIIGPQGSALIYIWSSSTTPASPSYAPELSFWVR